MKMEQIRKMFKKIDIWSLYYRTEIVWFIFGFIIGGALVAAAICLLNGSGCKDGYTLLGDDECPDKRNVIVVQAAPVEKKGLKYRKLRY